MRAMPPQLPLCKETVSKEKAEQGVASLRAAKRRARVFAPGRSAKPGDIVVFGRYPQTAAGADRTPIRWRVLRNTGAELFVLSERILDAKRYHGAFADTTWRDCDLRKWLNGEFYNAAFNAAEKNVIRTVRCADNGAGRPDTRDKVFLLGAAEAQALAETLGKSASDALRRATGTEFAKVKKADGCRLYAYNLGGDRNYVVENGQRQGVSWWWLRTQLGQAARATFVGTLASIRGYGRVNLPYYGVRPALKLRLR